MGNGCKCPCNARADYIESSNMGSRRPCVGEYVMQNDPKYYSTMLDNRDISPSTNREHRDLRSEEDRNRNCGHIHNGRNSGLVWETTPNKEYDQDKRLRALRPSSLDGDPKARKEYCSSTSSPRFVVEIEQHLLKQTEESCHKFGQQTRFVKIRGTDFDRHLDVDRYTDEEYGSKAHVEIVKNDFGSQHSYGRRIENMSEARQDSAPPKLLLDFPNRRDIEEKIKLAKEEYNLSVLSIRPPESRSKPNRTLVMCQVRNDQSETNMIVEEKHKWVGKLCEPLSQRDSYVRSLPSERKRSALKASTYKQPVSASRSRNHEVKRSKSPTPAKSRAEKKITIISKIQADDSSCVNPKSTMYQFTVGVSGGNKHISNPHSKQDNFWTDLNGIQTREAGNLFFNNLSVSAFSDIQKCSSRQQPSPGIQKEQSSQQTFLGPNFTTNPFEEVPRGVRKISIESIDATIQDDYFAEFDKDIASTPENLRFCDLLSERNDSSIELATKKVMPSRTTSLLHSFRGMCRAEQQEQVPRSSVRMKSESTKSPILHKDRVKRNWIETPPEVDWVNSIKHYPGLDGRRKKSSSSPELNDIYQNLENALANVRCSSILVDQNIPMDSRPVHQSKLLEYECKSRNRTPPTKQNHKLDMFLQAQNREFSSLKEHDESSWQGNYEFICIGNPQLGMGEQDIEEEFSRRAVTFINRRRPKFVVICGDFAHNLQANWSKGDLEVGRRKRIQELRAFKKIYSKIDRSIPLVCVCGDHDVGDKPTHETIQLYKKEFGDDYLTFWAGGVKFIVLNSQIIQGLDSNNELSIAHEKWLNEELVRQHRKKPVHLVIMCHIPPFCWDIREKNSNFNWPLRKRLIWLEKMVDANVKKIYCSHYQRRSGGMYNGLEVVVSAPIGTQICTKPIPGEIKGSRLREINFRLSFDASGGIKTSENTSGLQVVTVSKNELSERWYSVAEITKANNQTVQNTKLESDLVLSKFTMNNEFVSPERNTSVKISPKGSADKPQVKDQNEEVKNHEYNEPLVQPGECENFDNEHQLSSKENLDEKFSLCFTTLPPNLTYSLDRGAQFQRSAPSGASQKSLRDTLEPISTTIDKTNDSIYNKEAKKDLSPYSEKTKKSICLNKADLCCNLEVRKSPPLLLQQPVNSNETSLPPGSTTTKEKKVNSKISSLKKRQSSRVPLTNNHKLRKMKFTQAKDIMNGVEISDSSNGDSAAQLPKVAEWSVQEVLDWLESLDSQFTQYLKVFKSQKIDGRRLLVLMSCDLLYNFVRNRKHVLLIICALEKLAPRQPDFGWNSKNDKYCHLYKIMELMSIGQFSTTHQAVDLNNGNRICALKLVCRDKGKHPQKKKLEKLAIREVALKIFFSKNPHKQHENMINFYQYHEGVCYRGARYDYVVVREHHKLDLGFLCENRIALGEDISRRILHQLVSLLCFFREWKVGHFDLQPKNLLVQEDGWIIKVAGWSNYRQFTKNKYYKYYKDAGYNHLENRSYYMAPELWERRKYGLAADSWSLGAILCNLITGYLPFKHRTRADPAYNALLENKEELFWKANWDITRGLMPSTKSIIFNLLNFNAEERLDIENVEYEEFFQGRILSNPEYGNRMKNNFEKLSWRLD